MQSAASSDRPSYLGFVDSDAAQLTIGVMFPTSPGRQQKRAERLVMVELMRLEMSALREQLGATYGVDVSQIRRTGPGLLTVSADVDSKRAVESYQALMETLERVRTGDVTASFVRARRVVLRRLLADSVDSASVADELQESAVYDLSPEHFTLLAQRVARLRLAQVKAVIDTDLTPDGSVVMLAGERATIDEVYAGAGVAEPRIVRD